MNRAALSVLTLVLITGCAREAGPHDFERGNYFYWEVTGSELTFGEQCSDAPAFRDELAPPEFAENSFLLYRLSDDGATAVTQDCTTTDPSSCAVSDTGIVFQVSGSTLTWDPEPELRSFTGSTCSLEADQLWTLTDEGETLSMDLATTFGLVGDPVACAALETEAEAQAPNGEGYDACVITIAVDTAFHSAQSL